MRLTYKDENFKEYCSSATVSQLTQKLGQLEDIEKLWDIELLTLFKAFNGLFYKKDNEIKFSCHIAVIDYGIYILEESMTIGEGVCVSLKDYRKTWALTREELE